jgi:hypothetical protein
VEKKEGDRDSGIGLREEKKTSRMAGKPSFTIIFCIAEIILPSGILRREPILL